MTPSRKRHSGSPDGSGSPPTPSPEPAAAGVEWEAIEGLRDDFDEAALHVAQHREYTGFRLGPVVDVPSSELDPGMVGWRRRVDWGPPTAAGEEAEPDAWLSLLIGAHGLGGGPPEGPAPRTEVRLGCGTTPRSVLIARARSEVGMPLLERLARGTCAELESGD